MQPPKNSFAGNVAGLLFRLITRTKVLFASTPTITLATWTPGRISPASVIQAPAVVDRFLYWVIHGISLCDRDATTTSSATTTLRHREEPSHRTRDIRRLPIKSAPLPNPRRQRCCLNQSIPRIGSKI